MISRYSLFITILFIVIFTLQYDFWWSKTGFFATQKLNQKVTAKQEKNNKLLVRNMRWYADIVLLRQNDSVLEGMPRTNLGIIKNGKICDNPLTPQDKKVSLKKDN